MGVAAVGMCHCQRFSEYPLLTILVRTYHVARLQYQGGMMAKTFRTLDLTITVAVYG
jgi:hypothetical protein